MSAQHRQGLLSHWPQTVCPPHYRTLCSRTSSLETELYQDWATQFFHKWAQLVQNIWSPSIKISYQLSYQWEGFSRKLVRTHWPFDQSSLILGDIFIMCLGMVYQSILSPTHRGATKATNVYLITWLTKFHQFWSERSYWYIPYLFIRYSTTIHMYILILLVLCAMAIKLKLI